MPTLRLARDKHTGRRLGRYEILCQLSAGGMSEIYLGFQRGLSGFTKLIVLKCIRRASVSDEGLLHMFLDEGRIHAALNHPNIGQVYDLGEDDGQLYLALEFIGGATLTELAKALYLIQEPIPIGYTLATVRDTALALHYAHTFKDAVGRPKNVIHRDVAGKNIMVTYEGVTKLLDFGIAKVSASMEQSRIIGVKGTSGYMAPEQLLDQKVDARTDVFALGVVLHECLTGKRLFTAKNFEDEMRDVLNMPAPAPSSIQSDVPEEIDPVVLKALAKDPNARHGSALELAREIEAAAGYLLWRPEQRGELIQKHFGERREQVRSLFASLEQEDSTGDVDPLQLLRTHTPPPARTSGSHRPPAPAPPVPAPALDPEDKTPAIPAPQVLPLPPSVSLLAKTMPGLPPGALSRPRSLQRPHENLGPEARTVMARLSDLPDNPGPLPKPEPDDLPQDLEAPPAPRRFLVPLVVALVLAVGLAGAVGVKKVREAAARRAQPNPLATPLPPQDPGPVPPGGTAVRP
jgi:serine/threonine protein kinase